MRNEVKTRSDPLTYNLTNTHFGGGGNARLLRDYISCDAGVRLISFQSNYIEGD